MPPPISPDEIARAADLLRRGLLVAFPTETVYGLGADATNADAVARIFAAKGRPSTNPLIVHAADLDGARRHAGAWPESAERIARAFWPGPVTVVVPRGPAVVDGVTGGGPTVGLRVPDHPVALALLRAFGAVGSGAVAGPSANRSNRVSPTAAQHVADEFGEAGDGRPVATVLEGGPCRVGIESTVVDCTGDMPTVLRPGGVTTERLVEVVGGPVRVRGGVDAGTSASPGRSALHYAPRTPAFRFDTERRPGLERWYAAHPHRNITLVTLEDVHTAMEAHDERRDVIGTWVLLPDKPAAYAHEFYRTLRLWDTRGLEAIWIEMPPDRPEWAAVRDRIARATTPVEELASTKR